MFKLEIWATLVLVNLELSYIHTCELKSTCIFMSSRWSDSADLTVSIFQYLAARSPIWT